MKHKFDLEEILSKIRNQEQFEGELTDCSVYIKIEEYVPFVCFAIHNGHNLRADLQKNCNLSDKERKYEEDPFTFEFISSMPIVIASNDSRYEYDLNRSGDSAIYDEVWGKKVWRTQLTAEQKAVSLKKHKIFYMIVDDVLQTIIRKFNAAIVFDIHSYNYKRIDKDTPVFNIGTANINRFKFGRDIDFWKSKLNKIVLPNIINRVAENEVFSGNGYLLKHITAKNKNVLVLATEIKKIYCDELNDEVYPVIIDEITKQLKPAILSTTKYFLNSHTKIKLRRRNKLLSSEISPEILQIDKQLYSLVKNFEILTFINPANIEQARKDFFRSKYSNNPKFIYKQLSIDAFELKRNLYKLPLESIQDISIKLLYHDIIDSYADKIDIISAIGTDRFLYNSLRYFGEPKINDIKNAEYLLHFKPLCADDNKETYSSLDVEKYFRSVSTQYGFNCKIQITNKIISKVQVLNSKKTVLIRKDSMFSKKALKALAAHEIGVHMLTTINSLSQTLSVFKIGTPKNTHTQEGLAILSEYLSGNLTIDRLHFLAMRVIVIGNLLKGLDFKTSFHYLMDQGVLNETQAFYLTARVYRGGGFTKDYLYLQGFKDVYRLHRNKLDLKNLLIGKASLNYLPLINEMIERKIFAKPPQITNEFINPANGDPIIDYVLSGLK